MTSWQEKLITHHERISHILETGDFSDVTFIVGEPPEEKTFELHKVILSLCSDVFSTMFFGSQLNIGRVRVPDISPEVFEITMKYVYEETFNVGSMEKALLTYRVAEKYNIAHLRKLCINYIVAHLQTQNIYFLFLIPDALHVADIKLKFEKILREQTLEILTSDSFLKYPSELLITILQLQELNVEKEENLFDFVLKWAKHKRNSEPNGEGLRKIMEDFLPNIRFLAMSVESFLTGPGNCDVLTDSEISCIAGNLVKPGCKELPPWCHKGKSRKSAKIGNKPQLCDDTSEALAFNKLLSAYQARYKLSLDHHSQSPVRSRAEAPRSKSWLSWSSLSSGHFIN